MFVRDDKRPKRAEVTRRFEAEDRRRNVTLYGEMLHFRITVYSANCLAA